MGKSKKVVLFIVEGITEEDSLALVLSRIIEKDKILRFKIINGDITAKYGVNSTNINNKITEHIKEFINRDIYKKSDILNVIHLVDTDGTFINENMISQKDIEGFEYTTENIYTNLPYDAYFFSSNLEHVLHNQQSVLKNEKINYAGKFADKFEDNPTSFIEFMNNPEFALSQEYKETWDFIKKDANSLKRYTNFNLYLNTIKN